jgi:nucleoside-diphosphate-sugar epimerase
MRVLVTGASGFVGGAACRTLADRGHEVQALVRRPGSEPAGAAPVSGDLADADSLQAALADARPEAVLHLAAEIASQRSAERIEEVNVRGTERLVAAAEAAGVRRLVFTSTVVTGDAKGALLSEDSPLPVETAYGRSKQTGEQLVLGSTLEGIVIRPSHVYGPGGWYAGELIPLLERPGRFAVIGSGENLWDVVHVDDVAAACADALERAEPGALFHCADDEPITYYEFMALTARELGTKPPRRIPAAIARLAAGRDTVVALTRSARSSNSRLKSGLNWSPRYPTARDGVPAAIAALEARHAA